MGILIAALVDSLISFLMYKFLENGKKLFAFITNIVCLLIYYFIVNGLSNYLLFLLGAIVNGCLFSLIGIQIYKKQKNLNKFLGTTVLIELGISILTGLLFATIVIKL